MKPNPIPTVVLGATGYVGGEVLRLLAHHPYFVLEHAVARSAAGEPIGSIFPHLEVAYQHVDFSHLEQIEVQSTAPLAIFSCLPHGQGAGVLDDLIRRADTGGRDVRVVDLSADFRLPNPDAYKKIYGQDHLAPHRYEEFACALPDLTATVPSRLMAHPGCFTTATTLACAPLAKLDLCDNIFRVSAVTGSTGSGREPKPGTHHPERHSSMVAYKPLCHRHAPEMEMLLERATGTSAKVLFTPHSGPYARGIHATVFARLKKPMSRDQLLNYMESCFEATSFVQVKEQPPRLKEVVGSNRCHLSLDVQGQDVVVFSVIDNLIKGAAGGAVQWMNRLFDLEQETGLLMPGLGWN